MGNFTDDSLLQIYLFYADLESISRKKLDSYSEKKNNRNYNHFLSVDLYIHMLVYFIRSISLSGSSSIFIHMLDDCLLSCKMTTWQTFQSAFMYQNSLLIVNVEFKECMSWMHQYQLTIIIYFCVLFYCDIH